MKRNYILSLLAVLVFLPFTSLKAQQYDAGDSTWCYNLMTNNFATTNLLTTSWSDPNPANWLGVIWNTATPQRIIQLELKNDGAGNIGNLRGTSWPIQMSSIFSSKYDNFTGSGVDSRLKGNIDFTALTELVAIDLRQQDSILDINVSGLNNLGYFYFVQNSFVDTLDLSNLPNLIDAHIHNNSVLNYVDASNCPRLKIVKGSRGGDILEEINLAGSDSIILLCLGDADLTSLDVTGKTELRKLKANQNLSLQSITGLSTCSKLFALSIADNDLSGMIDLADFDTTNMYKFNIRNNNSGSNHIDTVANWMTMNDNSPEVVGVADNWLTLNNATQIFNELAPSNNYYGSDQIRYGGDTIYVGDTKDYSFETPIDITGNNIASSFELFDWQANSISVNATGIFTFPTINDTGEYYVVMTNPGDAPASNPVLLTTNNFWVSCVSGTGSQTLTICAGDTVMVGTSVYYTSGTFVDALAGTGGCDSLYTTNLTVNPAVDTSTTLVGLAMSSNEAGATYQWVDCNNGNSPIVGATNQTYTATANGDYAVEVTVNGCTVTSACVNILTVGIHEYETSLINIYPNPVSNMLTIELSEIANTKITVFSIEGKQVYNSTNINNKQTVIDATDWTKGVYLVKITDDNSTKTVRLIK